MGCWNETCVLTRTPIHYGADVVSLTTVQGPNYREPAGGGYKTALLFGLPLAGKYDDYGGIEELTNPELATFSDEAFRKAGMYREHVSTLSYGSKESRLIAAHPKILWGLEHSMKHFFYEECGVVPGQEDSYDEAASARSSAAFKRCEQALVKLGKALKAAELPSSSTELTKHLFALVQDAFGPSQAWGVWDYLRRNGLFANRGLLLMHRSAYDALVKEFSKHKVYYYGSKERQTLRSFLAAQLDEFVSRHEAERAKYAAMFAKHPVEMAELMNDEDDLVERMTGSLGRQSHYLKPLTSPWMTTENPLSGHFWGGATVQEVADTWPREALLDALVFQWGRHYLRLELTQPSSGSQNEEVVLHQKVHQAVYRDLRAKGKLKSDFSGCLHR